MRKPIIGIPADRRLLNSHWFHCVGEKYINAIVQAADAVPVLVPALGDRYLREWIASFDGILFTGSPSNVEPHRYLGPKSAPGTMHDPERDATTLPMITGALDAGLPILGICRGCQVLNVALGGTLHPHLPDVVGEKLAHRESNPDGEERHAVDVEPGSRLAAVMEAMRPVPVSSHHQAPAEVPAPLRVAARAEDGAIEAIEMPAHPWMIGVQWHPELSAAGDPSQQRLFDSLVAAARDRCRRQGRRVGRRSGG